MTFRRRLIIAFSIVLVLPVILFILSFIVIGNFLARGDNGRHQYIRDKGVRYFSIRRKR